MRFFRTCEVGGILLGAASLSVAMSAAAAFAGQPPPEPPPVKTLPTTDAEPAGRLKPEQIAEYQKAQEKFRQNDAAECLRLLETACKRHPELPPAEVMFARLCLTNNQAAVGRNLLERATIKHPDHPEVFQLFGEFAFAENRLTDAQLEFEKAASLAVAGKWSARQRQSWSIAAYRGLSAVGERRQDWPGAYEALYRLLQLEKSDAKVRQRLGQALFFLDKPEDAFTQLRQAFAADATLDPPELALGGLWNQKGDRTKAEALMKESVKAYPKDVRVYSGLASFYLWLGRADEARSVMEEALKIEPNSANLRLVAAVAARQAKDYSTAEKILTELAAAAPADFVITNQLALACVEQAEEAKRRRAFDLASVNIRLYPKNVEAATTVGWVEYRLGKLDEAEKILQDVFNTRQASSDAVYCLAAVLAEKGRKDDAKKLAQSALAAPGMGTFIHRLDCIELQKKLDGK